MTPMLKTTRFDFSEILDSEEMIQEYLTQVFADNDPDEILRAINNVAKARGMTELAKKTGIPRESIYRALSEKGNPTFRTLWKILTALDIHLLPKEENMLDTPSKTTI